MEHDVIDWPFFNAHHGVLARDLDARAAANLADAHGADVDAHWSRRNTEDTCLEI
jgi:hypothetical protein